MRYIFFLIPLLLLIPLNVDALRGETSETIINGDGSITKTLGLPPYIHDGNSYVPFIFTDTGSHLQVETNHGSVQVDKTTCKINYWKNGIINSTSDTRLLGDFIVPLQGTSPTNLSPITQILDETCQTSWDGTTLSAKLDDSAVGSVEYKYILNNGKWKTELNTTNTSGLNDRYFGFTQTINLERDTINWGGSIKNLDSFDGTTFDRTWLENNQGKFMDLMNGFYFDFDIAFDNLEKVVVTDTGINKSRLEFYYTYNAQILPDGQSLILDPTFGDLTHTTTLNARADNNTTVCGDNTWLAAIADVTNNHIRKEASGGLCRATAIEFDISNLPSNAEITDLDLIIDVDVVTSAVNCDVNQMSIHDLTDFGTDSQELWADIHNGTTYLDNNTWCTSTGNDKNLDLGTSADSDLEAELGNTEFSVAITWNDLTLDVTRRVDISDPRLSITYDMPPDIVNVFNATLQQGTDHTASSVLLEWECGTANGGSAHRVIIYRWDSSSWIELDNIACGASTTYTDLDPLDQATSMYKAVSRATLSEVVLNLGTFPMPEDLHDNLLSKYSFDWVTTDSGLLDNDGIVTGNELYLNDTTDSNFPIVGFDFNELTEIEIPNESDYDQITENPHGIVLSFKVDATPDSTEYLFTKFDGSQTNGIAILLTTTCDLQYWIIGDNPTTNASAIEIANSSLCNGSWQHTAFVNDGTLGVAGLDIFTNSSLASTTTVQDNISITNPTNNVTPKIGTDLDGAINDLLIFNTNPTSDNIADLYNIAATRFPRIDTDFAPDPPILSVSGVTFESADLSTSTPKLFGGTLIGYQVNFTTPFGNPLTIITNNTALPATVDDLTFATDYSFHIRPSSSRGNFTHSNIVNITTLGESFTVGQISINQTNPNLVDIQFERTVINTTADRLDVVYPNTYNLTCTLTYEFGRTTQSFSNLDNVTFSSTQVNSSFIFRNVTNDIVDVYCYNENDITQDGSYSMQWSNFPLLDQFVAFRSGDYGTTGEIGVLDFITVSAVLVAMIGLNRKNESVGYVFAICIFGVLAYFEIVALEPLAVGALIIVGVFIFMTTRKQ